MSDVSKGTISVGAVGAVALALISWWVNGQEAKIEEVKAETKAVAVSASANKDAIQAQKLEVVEDLSAIRTEQALSRQRQEAILKAIEDLKE